MNKLLKVVGAVLSVVIVLVLLFFFFFWVTEYRPDAEETVFVPGDVHNSERLPDTVKIVTWNIGYAGLGANMDFFYDGGTKVRDTQERTRANMDTIISVLQRLDADIVLLQEVDHCSKRTYYIDEQDMLQNAFPSYTLVCGYNYKALWVPIPLSHPMGRVESGVVTLSRVAPIGGIRYNYPSSFSFPVRLFNLKRCLLSTPFIGSQGDTLYVANTHNTAYDEGGMRLAEINYLSKWIAEKESPKNAVLIGGDWNQYPPGYRPSKAEISNPYFVPQPIDSMAIGAPGRFVYDDSVPTLRFLDRPYDKQSICSMTDFFWASSSLKVLSVNTIDLKFVPSDHQPVVITVTRQEK